ncbi:MAG TPA: hypothetical protein VMF13_20690, partial [Luteitalea sp.]|nr:hypothetical protein [Luteitalea sp.]
MAATRLTRSNSTLMVLVTLTCSVAMAASALLAQSPARTFALTDATGLRPHNVTVTPANLAGRAGVRVVMDEVVRKRVSAMTPEERQRALASGDASDQLAIVEGVQFGNGTIEAEIAGAPGAQAGEGARG